jgi:hypothetical protein
MNRIYQGRVSFVQFPAGGKKKIQTTEWEELHNDPKEARKLGVEVLWNHHILFQDAVNYYIAAIAALGTSPSSKLTKLAGLLGGVWENFDKKGQTRQGMASSLQRVLQLQHAPSLHEVFEFFRSPLLNGGVDSMAFEKAGEFLLHKLGGEAAIQQGGREFWPMFCNPDTLATFKLSATRLGRVEDEARLQRELHSELNQTQIESLAASISLGSVVALQPDTEADTGETVKVRLRDARTTFDKEISEEAFEVWLGGLPADFKLPKRRGGNINVERVNACTLFLAFPNHETKALFQSTFRAPKADGPKQTRKGKKNDSEVSDEDFIINGEDPIKISRGTRGCVFPAFTSLPIWRAAQGKPSWSEFDIAAFKEALKVYNQFQQNVEKRTNKLNGFALKLLYMDGQAAIDAYTNLEDQHIQSALRNIWDNCGGKPKLPQSEAGEETIIPRFFGDSRIDRLRQIINDDLAEEYRLTEGKRTPYGLRRRTIKGWSEVKRRWQSIAKKGTPFSEEKKRQLQDALDELRGGEKREQIGSHKLFEALIGDEAAWDIWQEPGDQLLERISKEGWAADPLEAFRDYCETREALEETLARPLNFTPADPRFSRRLFMFTDTCSFGNDRGEYRHDASAKAVVVPVAVRDADGLFSQRACRLLYSAPRLLRDRIRSEDGAYVQDWAQPMVRALLGASEEKLNPQNLKDAAVQLMPDRDANGGLRILLNFPLDLDDKRIKAAVGKAELWEKQFVTWKKGSQLPFLRWGADFNGEESSGWWTKVSGFSVLAADLGTRHAASIALVDFSKSGGGTARPVGKAGGQDWFGKYRTGSILRLAGEDAVVLRPESPLDKGAKGIAFRTELHGERGRLADSAEAVETLADMKSLGQQSLHEGFASQEAVLEEFSFPELNDKMLVAIRRAQGAIAACISWHWKLSKPDSEEQRQDALRQIREQDKFNEWKALADGTETNLEKLRDALHMHIVRERQSVQECLLRLTHRILPLRRRLWEWAQHPEKTDCHLLRQTLEGTGPEKVKLRGQRGLGMARIEQISELRRRWQSLNQSLRRQIGEKPLTASQMRNDPIPDPCPDLLIKLENIREQRVNQTAHLILAQALGLKLAVPRMSKAARNATDTHGEYEAARTPVDFIVVEDLSRYLSDQGRAKSENTRLMKWCHRAVVSKLKMLAEPFGLPVLETPAAYSSRFCSLTGVAGFRATEVGWNDRSKFRWKVLLQEDPSEIESRIAQAASNKAKREPLERRLAEVHAATKLFAALEEIKKTDKPNLTLLAPQPGGSIFLTAKEVPHPAPNPERGTGSGTAVPPMQADLNAACNLALRAVSNPSAAHIHHRLRTERKKSAGGIDTFSAREIRRFGKEKVALVLRDGDSLPKERNPNLFYDAHQVAAFGRAALEGDSVLGFPYASGPGLWKQVNDRMAQWRRCASINAARLASWGIDYPPTFPERVATKRPIDQDDDIPM